MLLTRLLEAALTAGLALISASRQRVELCDDCILTVTASQPIEEKQVRRRLTPDHLEGLSIAFLTGYCIGHR